MSKIGNKVMHAACYLGLVIAYLIAAIAYGVLLWGAIAGRAPEHDARAERPTAAEPPASTEA